VFLLGNCSFSVTIFIVVFIPPGEVGQEPLPRFSVLRPYSLMIFVWEIKSQLSHLTATTNSWIYGAPAEDENYAQFHGRWCAGYYCCYHYYYYIQAL
jgi:hypothetical protein